MFFVDDGDYGQAVSLTRAPAYLVERRVGLAVAHHDVLRFVDALPVHEKNLAGLYALTLLEVIENHRMQLASVGEGAFQPHIALQMELARREPYESRFLVAVGSVRLQCADDVGQGLTDHDGLARTCGCLEYHLTARAAFIEKSDHFFGQFFYCVLLIS